jgi:uncharacterized membrane protein
MLFRSSFRERRKLMPTPTSIRKHPIHPMLVGLPIGLWVFAVVADVMHMGGGGPAWKEVARYCIGGGLVGALLAAVPGLIDLTSISAGNVRKVALTHMTVNLIVVGLFGLSFWLRTTDPLGGWPRVISGIGLLLLGFGGWLGGELVFVHGMGVEPAEAKGSGRNRRVR